MSKWTLEWKRGVRRQRQVKGGPAELTVQPVGPRPRRVSREGLGLSFCEHNCNANGTLPSNQMEKLFAFYFKEKIVF